MAKGKIPISDARDIGKKRGVPMVVMFAIHEDGEQFTVTTWGKTKALCRLAGSFGDQFAKAIFDGEVAPPQEEPIELPDIATALDYNRRSVS